MIFKDLIDNNKGIITISSNIIEIRNYQDIISFDDNKFKIKINDKYVDFVGKNISVKLLKEEELILTGNIEKIEYR